jgi:ATP-dependent DNA helicase RecG
LPITDQLLLDIAQMRDDGLIQPLPSMTVQKRRILGGDFTVIEVRPSAAPPVRYRGRVWIRIGPRRAIATREEEMRLVEKRRGHDLPFDIQSLTSSSLDDLNLDAFRREYLPQAIAPEILEANVRSETEQLKSLRFLDLDGLPTITGMLVIGEDPRSFIPGAYVQFMRIDGLQLTDPIRDQKEIDRPLPEVLRRLDDVLEAHNPVTSSISSASIDLRQPEYPIIALQQLTRNGVLHRVYEGTNAPLRVMWFNDRIEILSPGGPVGQVSRENFGQPGITDYRNPHLAESMKILGYVQRFGIGIALARKELENNGNPSVEFIVESTHVLAVVRRRL